VAGPGFSFKPKIIFGQQPPKHHAPKIKMAADLAASHPIDFIVLLAPQVGL
jgi:hypothetical protein